MGYGWSSEASIRIVTAGADVFLQLASGTSIRWRYNGASYEPLTPSNRTKIEVSGPHWRVTFQDQTKYLLDQATGRLEYKIDRNNNTSAYVPLSYDEHPNRVAFHRKFRGLAALPKDGHHGEGKAA